MNFFARIFGAQHEPSLWTGKVLSREECKLRFGMMEWGVDSTYAEVNAMALGGYYDWFRSELFRLGITKWDASFDCDNYAALYADLLGVRFFRAQWESARPPAQSPAVACYYYQSPAGPHAINAVLTDLGRIFIEPQNGRRLILTPDELASATRCIY